MYVMGVTSPEETAQVERWRAQYPEVKEELFNIETAMESYAAAHSISPKTGLKNEIFSSIGGEEKISSTKIISISPVWRSVAAAAVVLLITSAVTNVLVYNKYKSVNGQYEESQQQIALQTEKLNGMNRDMNVVQSKYSEPVSLHGLEAAPEAAAKIFWMKNTGEVYVDPSNLPKAPEGMQYQLWAIVDGKPVDGGMITLKDGQSYHIQKMKTFGKAQAFAITLETTGGNPEPKGKMYVMGEI